jgi:glutamate/tyrosine decarboxylase-like PLP-dependent enzyme
MMRPFPIKWSFNMGKAHNGIDALEKGFQYAKLHLDNEDTRPVGATTTRTELRRRLDRPLQDTGIPAGQVIDDLVRDVEGGLVGSTSGRFFGWVIGGTLPAALAADWLTSAWDQNAAIHACSPAEAVVEEVAGAWLKDLFGLPAAASFAFVTGTQTAHLTCLGAARHRLLRRTGWNVEAEGMPGALPIRMLTSTERHGSVERAVRLLGLGTNAIERLPCNSDGRLDPASLEKALAANSEALTIVVLQAGDLKHWGI